MYKMCSQCSQICFPYVFPRTHMFFPYVFHMFPRVLSTFNGQRSTRSQFTPVRPGTPEPAPSVPIPIDPVMAHGKDCQESHGVGWCETSHPGLVDHGHPDYLASMDRIPTPCDLWWWIWGGFHVIIFTPSHHVIVWELCSGVTRGSLDIAFTELVTSGKTMNPPKKTVTRVDLQVSEKTRSVPRSLFGCPDCKRFLPGVIIISLSGWWIPPSDTG